MTKEDFARTVQIKESIRQYVEQQPGDTFADKFENMEREKEIKKTAAQKEQQLKQLQNRIASLHR
ncbi:hypothetical protein U6B65_07415 [Oscillospiraceae bacterium MB08-C2-2]|nr:hypothetical protein U6B65_07415 [Oscillospiraceae bacterium MB08-C2-2]